MPIECIDKVIATSTGSAKEYAEKLKEDYLNSIGEAKRKKGAKFDEAKFSDEMLLKAHSKLETELNKKVKSNEGLPKLNDSKNTRKQELATAIEAEYNAKIEAKKAELQKLKQRESNIANTTNTNQDGKDNKAKTEAESRQGDVLTPNEKVGGNSPTNQTSSVEFKKGDKVQWGKYGNEDKSEWVVVDKVKTRGGQDAIELSRIKNTRIGESTEIHIVPLSDLSDLGHSKESSPEPQIQPTISAEAKGSASKDEQPGEVKKVEAGSGGVGGDVKQQELDAQKINKEAGVDVYVARQGVEANGEKYTLSQIKENGNTNTFVIEDANGSEIGKAQLSANGNYLENIRIDEKHRRKGLASKVYDFIELRKGIELEPSPNKQSKEAKALWDNRNLKKSVSNKANGSLLAKALGEAMSKTFADFKNKQQVLLELENKYFEQKSLSKEDFNKLNETEKAEIIKDAVKWENDNPELVKAVEQSLKETPKPEPPKETTNVGEVALKDVESTTKALSSDTLSEDTIDKIEDLYLRESGKYKGFFTRMGDLLFTKSKGLDVKNMTQQVLREKGIDPIALNKERNEFLQNNENLILSEYYHKAKREKSDPELVKAVEELLAPNNNVGEVKVEPIRQLGTGDNVYFESKGYRVNDSKNGEVLLIIRDENEKEPFPITSVKFDNVNEAVFIANKLNENRPNGLTPHYDIDKLIENLKEEYKNNNNGNEQQIKSDNLDANGNIRKEPTNKEELAQVENEIADHQKELDKQDSKSGIKKNVLPIKDIVVAPKTFQFKTQDEENGVNRHEKLDGKYDRNIGGSIGVWIDAKNELGNGEGKVYVVDGHHRMDLAKRSGEQNIDVFYIDAPTAKEARLVGAKSNIAQGRGTAIDAAKIYRDATPLQLENFSPKSKVGKEGKELAKLSQPIFDLVAQEKLDIQKAIAIAQVSEAKQEAFYKAIKRIEDSGAIKMSSKGLMVMAEKINSGEVASNKVKQVDLFGTSEKEELLLAEQSQLEADIKDDLSKDAKILGNANKNKEVLEKANNVVNVDENNKLAEQSKTASALYDTYKKRNSVASIIKQATEDLSKAPDRKTKQAIREKASADVKSAIQKELNIDFGKEDLNLQQVISPLIDKAKTALDKAQRELDNKRNELDKNIQGDNQDLFGKAKNNDNALFDNKADASQREKVLEPYKKAVENARESYNKAVENERNKPKQLGVFETPINTEEGGVKNEQTDKQKAKDKLDEAILAFRKSGGLSSGGLESLPELIDLVRAYADYGYESVKEAWNKFKNDFPESKLGQDVFEKYYNEAVLANEKKIPIQKEISKEVAIIKTNDSTEEEIRDYLDYMGYEKEDIDTYFDSIKPQEPKVESGSGQEPPKVETTTNKDNEEEDGYVGISESVLNEERGIMSKNDPSTEPTKWKIVVDKALDYLAKNTKEGQTLYDTANDIVTKWAYDIYDSLSKGEDVNFAPTARDVAVMSYYRTKTYDEIKQLEMSAFSPSQLEKRIAQDKFERLQQNLRNIDYVLKESGSVQGLAFNIKQMVSKMQSDNSMLIKKMEIQNIQGKPLSEDQLNELTEIGKLEKKRNEDFAKVASYTKEDFDKAVAEHIAKWKKENAKSNTSSTKKEKTLKDSGDALAEKLQKLKVKGLTYESTLAIPIALYNTSIDIISGLVKGGATLAQAIKDVVERDEFKGKITEEQLQNHIVKGLDKSDILDKIKEISEKEKIDTISRTAVAKGLIRDLAEQYFEEGKSSEEIFKAMKEDLSKIYPNISEVNIEQAYAKIGGYTIDSKEKLNEDNRKAHQELKTIAILKDKIEQAKQGKLNAKSESVKKSKSAEEEKYRKELDKLLKDNYYDSNSTALAKEIKQKVADEHNKEMDNLQKNIDEILKDKSLDANTVERLNKAKDKIEELKLSKGLKNLEEQTGRIAEDLHLMSIDNNEISSDINKAISNVSNNTKNATQDILVEKKIKNLEARTKKNTELLSSDIPEIGDKAYLSKTNKALIDAQIADGNINAKYQRMKELAEQKNLHWSEKLGRLAYKTFVSGLIGHTATGVVVASSGIAKQPLETFTNALGSPFHWANPTLSKYAGAETRFSPLKEQARFMAYAGQIGEKGMQEMVGKADTKLSEAQANYTAIQKDKNATESQIKKAKSKYIDALVARQSLYLFDFLGSKAWTDSADVLFKGASKLQEALGHDLKVGWKDKTALEKQEFVLGIMGDMHGYLKSFSARAEFAGAFVGRLQNKANRGEDISTPDAIYTTAVESYVDYLKGKYQEDNYVTSTINAIGRAIGSANPQKFDPNTEPRKSTVIASKIGQLLFKTQYPIIRTGVNIGREALVEYAMGSIIAPIKQALLIGEGVKSYRDENANNPFKLAELRKHITKVVSEMPTKEVDFLFKCYRKGGVGLVMMGLAGLGYVKFGGFRDEEDWRRKHGELKQGELEVMGVNMHHSAGSKLTAKILEHLGVFYPSLIIANAQSYFDRNYNKNLDKEDNTSRNDAFMETMLGAMASSAKGAENIVPLLADNSNPFASLSLPISENFGDVQKMVDKDADHRDKSTWVNRLMINNGLGNYVPLKEGKAIENYSTPNITDIEAEALSKLNVSDDKLQKMSKDELNELKYVDEDGIKKDVFSVDKSTKLYNQLNPTKEGTKFLEKIELDHDLKMKLSKLGYSEIHNNNIEQAIKDLQTKQDSYKAKSGDNIGRPVGASNLKSYNQYDTIIKYLKSKKFGLIK